MLQVAAIHDLWWISRGPYAYRVVLASRHRSRVWYRTDSRRSPRRAALLAWSVVAVSAGCLQAGCAMPAAQDCLCPPGLLCMDTGTQRVCVAAARCGDGRLDPGEVCDDGNTLDGDGCAADCRSLDGVFLVTPPMVRFTAIEGGTPPAPVAVKIQLARRGDTVLVGEPPGAAQPTWLSIAEAAASATTAELMLRATDTSVVGDHSTTVGLQIVDASTVVATFDLPVAYRVEPFELVAQATPEVLAFTASTGQPTVASQALDVAFNGDDLVVVSVPPWAAVSAPTDATSPAQLAVSITDTSFAAGTVLSDDLVLRTTRAASQRTLRVHVSYRVVAPPVLAIEAVPDTLTFTAFHGAAAPPSQNVIATFNGERVDVVEAPPWVTVSAPDPVTSPASLAVSVNDTSFTAGTVLSDGIVLRTTQGTLEVITFVHVDYRVEPPPDVELVAPYVGVAGRPGVLRLRGHDFRATDQRVTVGIGDLRLGPVVTDGDTQITVSYPALPAGRYPVIVVDPPGIAPSAPELVVVAPRVYGYQAVDAPGARARIIYDAEREAIYAVNTLDQRIEHFTYSDAWSAHAPHSVPLLTDIALAPDGRSLIVIDRDHVNEMSLTDDQFVLVQRADNPAPYLGGFCDQTAAADNGKVLLLLGTSCSQHYLYDLRDRSMVSVHIPYAGFNRSFAGVSGDGSRIYVGNNDFYPPSNAVSIFESLSDTVSIGNVFVAVNAITVSGDASRVIVNNTNVYSRSLTFLGSLPGRGTALASRDSARAFVYVENAAGARIEVHDLNGSLQADGTFPLLETVMLTDAANGSAGSHPPVAMTSSLDDAVVFVSGDRKLLVVPVN